MDPRDNKTLQRLAEQQQQQGGAATSGGRKKSARAAAMAQEGKKASAQMKGETKKANAAATATPTGSVKRSPHAGQDAAAVDQVASSNAAGGYHGGNDYHHGSDYMSHHHHAFHSAKSATVVVDFNFSMDTGDDAPGLREFKVPAKVFDISRNGRDKLHILGVTCHGKNNDFPFNVGSELTTTGSVGIKSISNDLNSYDIVLLKNKASYKKDVVFHSKVDVTELQLKTYGNMTEEDLYEGMVVNPSDGTRVLLPKWNPTAKILANPNNSRFTGVVLTNKDIVLWAGVQYYDLEAVIVDQTINTVMDKIINKMPFTDPEKIQVNLSRLGRVSSFGDLRDTQYENSPATVQTQQKGQVRNVSLILEFHYNVYEL